MTDEDFEQMRKPEYLIGTIAALLQAQRLTLSVLTEDQRYYVTEGMNEYATNARLIANQRDTDHARDHAEAAWRTARVLEEIEDWVATYSDRLRD